MTNISRRNLIKASAAGAVGASTIGFASHATAAAKKVVIVGGGIGGATAAQYLKKMDSSIDVTIVEYNKD
jgi:sulfide dehydrogenase [flavocytochrome c] flavoprotein subunit